MCILHMIQNHLNNNSQEPVEIVSLFEQYIENNRFTTDLRKFEFLSNDDSYGTLKSYYREKISMIENRMAELITIEDFSQFLKENNYNGDFQTLVDFIKQKFCIQCHPQSPMNYAIRFKLLFTLH